MAKQKFEEEWRTAFEGAEVSPSDNVWTSVELELEKTAGTSARKKLVKYQWLTAASVAFAMGVSALYFFASDEKPAVAIVQIQTDQGQGPVNTNEQQNSPNQPGQTTARQQGSMDAPKRNRLNQGFEGKLTPGIYVSDRVPANPKEKENVSAGRRTGTFEKVSRPLPPLFVFRNPEIKISKPEPVADPGIVLLAKLKDEEAAFSKEEKKKKKDEHLWTSIGFGAGSFNPNAGSASGTSAFNATGNSTSGMSYTVTANVGGRLGGRFVLQGGVAYLSQNASFTSSSFSLEASTVVASLDDYIDRQSNLVATTPYEVSSNLQYVSVPLQAGYVILDRQFAIQFNGGVATDLFIQSTLTPDNTDIASVTQKAGSDSPYRSVNFSGIVGTELSYKFANRYRIALNPGIRYAFNSIYKPDVSREIMPVTYDVAVRFRYIFN